MQIQNKYSIEHFSKTNKLKSFESSQYLNLPDLQFFIWCNQKYKVNRGVYNTIDHWFYEYGIVNIQYRRIQVLAFLDFFKDKVFEQDKQKYIRFGHGGLAKSLNEFINDL
ncbi:hypothetical protein BIV60_14815 [Bacillus sp. MUM 116]|uniref:hypothetical protein n=1 Tax=Bacillus sp. MUM 116 TaxID=1678002 RepID=UPI0008F5A2C1|nr:hypothetical protein [Bacillus sp. MUM 116]OIK13076.1 hypothetical protein BIV60_14815 [Bacillus sp. MUM 116]